MKLLVAAIVAVIANVASAAYQYNPVYDGSAGKTGGYFTFDTNTTLSMEASVYKTWAINPIYSIADFGYYNMNDNVFVSNQNGVLGSFNANDKIGIWISDTRGNVFTSTDTGKNGAIFDYSDQNGNKFCLYTGGKTWIFHPNHYEYELSYTESPTGQPLPGVLATVLCCGIAAAAATKKNGRKKNFSGLQA